MPFNVSLSLLYFFRDERSQSLVHVDDSFKTVNDLENHIRHIFKISEHLTLITKNHFLPGSESINLLSNNDEVIVLPRKDNHNIQPEASSSVPRKRRRAGDCKSEDLFQGTDRETSLQISAHSSEINESLEDHSPIKGNKKKKEKPKISKPQISETVKNDRPKRNKKSKPVIEDDRHDNILNDVGDTKSNIPPSVNVIYSIEESDEMVVDNSKKKKKKKPKMDSNVTSDRSPNIKMEFDETNDTSVHTTLEGTVRLDVSSANTENKSLHKSNENIIILSESSEENIYVQKSYEKPGKEKMRHSVTFNNKPYYNCRKNNIFTVGNFISNIGNVMKKYEPLEQSNSTQNNAPVSSLIRNPYCKSAKMNTKNATIKSEIEPSKELKNETISKNTNESKLLSKLQHLEDVANNVMSVENSENEINEAENVLKKNSNCKDNTATRCLTTELQKISMNGELSSDHNSENRIKLDTDTANEESTHENRIGTKLVTELSDKLNDNSLMKRRRRRRKKKIRNDDLILSELCIIQSEFVPPRTSSAPLIHIRFSDDDYSESDSTSMSDLTQTVTEIANGKNTESNLVKTDNESCTANVLNEQNVTETIQPEELLETNKLNTAENSDNIVITDYRKVDLTQHDLNGIKYTVMAREHLPEIGNIIAFKLYKFNDKYEPSVSHWTIGKVINFNQHAFTINLHILAGEVQIQIPNGKFSIEYGQEEQETTIHSDGIVELLWNDLLEPRLLHT